MNYFVIGDVHGCYFTFNNMLNKYWNRENEMIIQLGDIIDRGKNSPQMVNLAMNLSEYYPNQVMFLKGNHEYEIIEHFYHQPNINWLKQCGEETLKQYCKANRDCKHDVKWLRELPLYWENDYIFISHAGISIESSNPFIEDDEYGILWNRHSLKNINKLQIIGHTPCEQPQYHVQSNTWNIDTGAAYSGYLTGVKVKSNGEIIKFIKEETDSRDK